MVGCNLIHHITNLSKKLQVGSNLIHHLVRSNLIHHLQKLVLSVCDTIFDTLKEQPQVQKDIAIFDTLKDLKDQQKVQKHIAVFDTQIGFKGALMP